MMKHNIFASILCGALLFSACSLDCEYQNGPASGSFPNSESEALAGTLAAYKYIGEMNATSTAFPYRGGDAATDVGSYRADGQNYYKQLNSTLSGDQTLVVKMWPYPFKAAGRCHQVLDNIKNLEGSCSETVINQFKAELLCIRAHQYDQEMQFYGGIPFVDHCLTLDDCSCPRSTIKECADRLLADLDDELLDNLPIQWTPSVYGTTRIGRAAAYALKARIALNWGYVDVALAAAAKSLTLCEGVYGLEELKDLRYIPHDEGEIDVTNLYGFAGENSKEWLWAAQRSLAAGNCQAAAYSFAPRTVGGSAYFGVRQNLVDTYQCTDGLSIVESPLYNPEKPYENRDPRLYYTVALPGTRTMGVEFEMEATASTVMDYNVKSMVPNADASPLVNKYQYGPNQTTGIGGFLCRKYYDTAYYGSIDGTNNDELNTGLLRYAEILLIDAEANIESSKGDLSRAKKDLDKLRTRVGMPTLKVNDRDGLRKALRYERKVELALEGFRWFDIRRWAKNGGLCYENGVLKSGVEPVAVDAVNGPQWAPTITTTKDPKAFYSMAKPVIDDNWVVNYVEGQAWPGKTFNLRKFDKEMVYNINKDRFWPIPYTELETNAALDPIKDQNPGY